ncbi:cytidine deaminase-like fold-containing protein [Pseudomonas fluorescens]|uniref:cytidine deaminase-like fold-containing protein n=1 Tax=Pseudomonas fluorescens TaxID=294 RepID=UPI003CCAB7D9
MGDAAFTDVNQTARPIAQANPDEPNLIADRVATKIEATGKPLPNGNMADAHAEIEVIQQAYNAGKTQGADMAMSVAGKDVCGFCKGDIAAAAEKAGLKSLTVQAMDDVTGLPKKYNWVPGMQSIKEVP